MAASEPDASTGYRNRAYAVSLRCHGAIRDLPLAGGWALEQPLPPSLAQAAPASPSSQNTDLRGGYPLFACTKWARLHEDLDALEGPAGPIAFTAVPDPYGQHQPETLQAAFPDHCEPYKVHYGVDLKHWEPPPKRSQHHRNAQHALGKLNLEIVANPSSQLDRWCHLYENLIRRHQIQGIATFGTEAFASQLALPDLRMLVARCGDEIVGALLWLLDGDVATYHLAAYDDVGYSSKASFALFWHSIEAFREGQLGPTIRHLNLGGAAGIGTTTDKADGLARFKSGWSNTTRQTFVCGRILNRVGYAALTKDRPTPRFFPAYRAP